MSKADISDVGSTPSTIIIPSTAGPVQVLYLYWDGKASGEMPSGAVIGMTTKPADIAKAYDRFVRRPTGLVHRLFDEVDPKPYLLSVSADINSGESWQLSVMLAHALEHAGAPISQDLSVAKRLIWATGTISIVDYAIGGVAHVSEKLRLSGDLLRTAVAKGRVEIFIPVDNRASIDPDVTAWLTESGLTIRFVRTLDECLAALGLGAVPKAMSRAGAMESRWEGNPYRGLKAFLPEHRRIFFGRARAREEALERLQEARARRLPFLLVSGRSGVGKSSFAQAGLLNDLIEQFPENTLCRHAIIRPSFGVDGPAAALLAALQDLAADDASTDRQGSPLDAADLLRDLRDRADLEHRYVLVIDQLEELFSDAVTPDQIASFEDLLDATVRSNAVWVIATLRSDALGLLDRCPKLARLAEGREYRLREPSVFELSEIIAGPAAAAGRTFADRTVPEGLAQIASRSPDSLPVLQAVLYRLFDNAAHDRMLSMKDLDRLGGFGGAVAIWADEARDRIIASGVSEEAFARQLAALVRIEPETRLALTRTIAYAAADPKIVDILVEDRLVTKDDGADGPRIRLVHEILTVRWPYLADLVGRLGEAIAVRDELDARAAAWEKGGHRPEDLVRGARLATANAFLSDGFLRASPAVAAYVDASRGLAAAEEAQAARLADAELKQAQLQTTISGNALRQQRRWTRAAAVVSLVLGVCALAILALYFEAAEQKHRAEAEAANAIQMAARARQKEAEAKTVLIDTALAAKDASDQSVTAALATINGDMIDYAKAGETAEARDLTRSIYAAAGFIRTSPVATHVGLAGAGVLGEFPTFSGDGKLVAIPGNMSVLRLLDADSGVTQITLPLEKRGVSDIAFSSPNNKVAFINFNEAYLFGYKDQTIIKLCSKKFDTNQKKWQCRDISRLIAIDYGQSFLAMNSDGTLTIFDAKIGKVLNQTDEPLVEGVDDLYEADGAPTIIAFKSRATSYAEDDSGLPTINENDPGRRPANVMRVITYRANRIAARDVAFNAPLSGKARIIARTADTVTIYDEPTIYTASIATGQITASAQGLYISGRYGRPVVFVPKSHEGKTAQGKDVLDIYSSSGRLVVPQTWARCDIAKPKAYLSRGLAYIYDSDGTICIYDIKKEAISSIFRAPHGGIFSLTISPDGTKATLFSDDDTVTIWPVRSMMASRPHEIPSIENPSPEASHTFRSIKGESGKYEFVDEYMPFANSLSINLKTDGYIEYAFSVKERTIYGRSIRDHDDESSGYIFSIIFAQDGTFSLAEQSLPPDADAIIIEGGLKALVQEKDCIAIWERRETHWERGQCLAGTQDALEIHPIHGGSLIGGITRDQNLLVWSPEETSQAGRVETRLERQGRYDLGHEGYWSLLSSTADDKYIVIGRTDGGLRIVDWRLNQPVAAGNLDSNCRLAGAFADPSGRMSCLRSARFDGNTVRLTVDEAQRNGTRVRAKSFVWEPDPAVWRATKDQLLAFALSLARLGAGGGQNSLDDWCTALANDIAPEVVNIRATFVARAILSAGPVDDLRNLPCSERERARWPSSLLLIASAMQDKQTTKIFEAASRNTLAMYGAASSLLLSLHGRLDPVLGKRMLEVAAEDGFPPAGFIAQILDAKSTCESRRNASRDAIGAGLAAQTSMGQSGMLRSVEIPLLRRGSGRVVMQVFGEHQPPGTALKNAAYAVSELQAFRDDSFVQQVRETGLVAAKRADIQMPGAVAGDCSDAAARP